LELDAMELDTGEPAVLELDSMEPNNGEPNSLDLYAGPKIWCRNLLVWAPFS
jgi:hypothetical protein